MKQELIEELCGKDSDPFTAEVMTWLPDEAFDEIINIHKKADEVGADQTTRNIQENVLKKYLPEDVFNALMEIDNEPWEKSNEEWDKWALEKVREIGRGLNQNREIIYRDFIRRLNSAISKAPVGTGNVDVSLDENGGIVIDVSLKCPAVNAAETGMAIESVMKSLSDDDLNSITEKLISEKKRRKTL